MRKTNKQKALLILEYNSKGRDAKPERNKAGERVKNEFKKNTDVT